MSVPLLSHPRRSEFGSDRFALSDVKTDDKLFNIMGTRDSIVHEDDIAALTLAEAERFKCLQKVVQDLDSKDAFRAIAKDHFIKEVGLPLRHLNLKVRYCIADLLVSRHQSLKGLGCFRSCDPRKARGIYREVFGLDIAGTDTENRRKTFREYRPFLYG